MLINNNDHNSNKSKEIGRLRCMGYVCGRYLHMMRRRRRRCPFGFSPGNKNNNNNNTNNYYNNNISYEIIDW